MTDRRQFLAGVAGTAWTAKSYGQIAGANERLRIGVIGCGGMAGAHMDRLMKAPAHGKEYTFTAVCDLYDNRRDKAAERTGGKPYTRYQDVLADNNVDYVLNATPEHWHARITLDAIEAGKHVYCEKPMTRTVEQAKTVVAKLKNYPKIKMQVGVQGMSDDSYITANRYVGEGVLGKVVLAQIDYSRNGKDDLWEYEYDPDIKPGVNFDWKTWLGDTPKREFDPDRFHRWRKYWDYSGGISGDLFVHRVTRIIKSLGLRFPEFGSAAGGRRVFTETKGDVPDTMTVLLDYPEGVTVQLVSSMANDRKIDHLLRGHKATLEFNSSGFTIVPQKLFAEEVKEITHKKSGAEDILLHHLNLQAAIRKGDALNCPAELGLYGVVASEMGVQSLRRRAYVKWDAKAQRIEKA
jgi:predicted dehydrogenase